ncbi:hypothetical protein PG637_02055 [Riemerella anatipestifer]|nr:hypothetical protein [Riemerella anatipestifer]MDY3324453.1 hypothetical protein [Riemerella anatipestifer]MDY3353268.1 hypothetical protein [Riemerella anatipestifer]
MNTTSTNIDKIYNRLKKLCEKVNTRNEKGLNDDDQAKALFDFEKKNLEFVRVAVGYSKLKAIKTEFVKRIIKRYKEQKLDLYDIKFVDDKYVGKLIGIPLPIKEMREEFPNDVNVSDYTVWVTLEEYDQI